VKKGIISAEGNSVTRTPGKRLNPEKRKEKERSKKKRKKRGTSSLSPLRKIKEKNASLGGCPWAKKVQVPKEKKKRGDGNV